MGVGEVVGADDTGTDSLLAGRETTDWPGHRRQRYSWENDLVSISLFKILW